MYKKTKFSIGVLSSCGTGVKFNRNKKSGTVLTDSSTFFVYTESEIEKSEKSGYSKRQIFCILNKIF